MKHFQNTPNYTCLRHRISQVIGSVKCQTNLQEHEGEQERLSARSEGVRACVQVQDCVRFVFFSKNEKRDLFMGEAHAAKGVVRHCQKYRARRDFGVF